MRKWRHQFGAVDRDEAFMHGLGIILSDGSLLMKRQSSRMTLPLSKKYDWSKNLGNATCYHLGLVGLRAKRVSDWEAPNNIFQDRHGPRRITGPGFRVWEASHSRILTWIRRGCLGLGDRETKSESPVNARWVLTAPKRLRVAFLQGISDGDGFVSVNSQEIGLASKCNQEFYRDVLNSLGIRSIITPKDVIIKQSNSIIRADESGLFRYAESRRENLKELADIVRARKSKPSGSRLTSREIEYAFRLRRRGVSYGGITRSMYHEFGISWDISTIEHAIKRRNRQRERHESTNDH